MSSDLTTATEQPGRRFLIATAVAHHDRAPEWDRPSLIDARNQIIDLFTTTLGYQHISDLGLDPTADQLTTHLRAFCRSPQRQPDDLLVVYVAGHGEVLDNGDHVLLTADTHPDDISDALPTADLARKMLLGTPIRRVLLMLDTCYSGRGGNDLVAAALARMTEHWQGSPDTGLVVFTSTQPAEQAQTGAFPRLLRAAVDSLATAGHTPPALPLDAVVTAMNANTDKPGFQTITSTLAYLTGPVPPFLPNPRHDPRLTEVDLAIQQASEWDAQAERRDIEFRSRLLVRAMGGDHASHGWWFAGRQTALLDIADWLGHPDPARPVLAVTAAPGSGKTAVLGLIATLTHPQRRVTVPVHTLGLPQAAIPAPDTVDVVIYAQNLTRDQVFGGILAALRIHAATVGELLERLSGRAKVATVVIDGLDEAAEPDQLVRQLLRPLVEYAQGRLRLLVGTRPHLLAPLGVRREDSVDLDAPRYADLDALTTYAARGLLESTTASPYPDQPPRVIHAVAQAVAQASHPSFLVARITSATLAAQDTVPDPADAAWRRGLPRLPGPAMRQDLETRLGERARMVRDLLRPLAYAEGQGLPWEDIWAALASRIAGVTYTDEDLLWLRRHAGSYVVEALEDGRSTYRLYHQALAEHLREDVDDDTVQRAFVQILRSGVPVRWDGVRDWARAHPYTLRYLGSHACYAGVLDDVISDLDYLVYASPDELLRPLHSVVTDEGRLTCAIYRASARLHRDLPPVRRRQVVTIDAARFDARQHQRELAHGLPWPPRWATGQQTSPALHTTLTGHNGAVHAVACIMLDGAPIAVTGGADHTVRVWDLSTGTLRTILTGHDGDVRTAACTVLDGTPIAVTGGDDKTVQVWDLSTGTHRMTLSAYRRPARSIACIDLDGMPVAVIASGDRTVQVWDLSTGALRTTLAGHDSGVYAVACTELDGTPIAVTGTYDNTVEVWDLSTGTLRTTLTGPNSILIAMACTYIAGTPVAVTGGADNTVRVWDLSTGVLRTTLTGHSSWVHSIACTDLAGVPAAVTASEDETVRVWDLSTGVVRTILTGHDNAVYAVTCAELGGTVVAVTGSADKTVRIWHMADSAAHHAAPGHTGNITGVATARLDGRSVAVSTSIDSTVRVWDLVTGSLRATLANDDCWVMGVACTELDGTPVAVTASQDLQTRVWDLSTGTVRTILTGHIASASSVVCAHLDGNPVAIAACDDRTIRIWDLATGTLLRTIITGTGLWVFSIACTEVEGIPIAVTGGNDKTVRMWDLSTGTLRTTLTGHDGAIYTVACTELDGTPVAVTGSDDNTIRVWDLSTGTLRTTLTGHSGAVHAVACTELDGTPVAVTGSDDNTIRVWDLVSHRELVVLDYPGRIYDGALTIGPANEIIVGAGWDLIVIDRCPR
jgi:WD40 repeat protein